MNYRKYLTEDILPFWLDNAIDHEYGGIFTHLNQYGEVYCKEEKSGWFLELPQFVRTVQKSTLW